MELTKRIFDIVLSSVALIILLPVLLTTTIVLRLTGEGEVLYRQKRIGQGCQEFWILKFATMLKNSPSIGSRDITVTGDRRVLPVGRFLRKTKLNEIPQFINVLIGDMSIVGPRPLTPRLFSFYAADVKETISAMRPGLTSLGSLVFRDEERIIAMSSKSPEQCYKEDISPMKARLESWYKNRRNVFSDGIVVLLTIWVVLFPSSKVYRKVFKDMPDVDIY
jgi:lipopolysaccharide/colanic/teichoic acid biosynthesis glycosyltransferase